MTIFSFTLFGIQIAPTWYGLMYAVGFLAGYWIIRSRKILSESELDSLVLYIFLGVILGWRLGYILFYDLSYYIAHPIDIIKTWNGGMSFHGGAIGVILAMFAFARKHKDILAERWNQARQKNMKKSEDIWVKDEHRSELYEAVQWARKRNPEHKDRVLIRVFLEIADQITSVLPIWLGLGRIGNYINKELLGFTPYTWPFAVEKNWAFYFPSPFLESFLEGIILFLILFYIMRRRRFSGQVAMHFLIWYGIFRFFIEFFRMPDPQIGYIFGLLTMGQILSIPMVIIGIILLFWKNKNSN